MNKPHTCSCAAAMICGPRPRAPLRDGQPDGLVGREHHTPENVLPREHGPICEAEPPQISAHCAWGPCPHARAGPASSKIGRTTAETTPRRPLK